MAKCSAGTALRDINELIQIGALHKTGAGGRSTAYELVPMPTFEDAKW